MDTQWIDCIANATAYAKRIRRSDTGYLDPDDLVQDCLLAYLKKKIPHEEICKVFSQPGVMKVLRRRFISDWRKEIARKRGGRSSKIQLELVENLRVWTGEEYGGNISIDPEKAFMEKETNQEQMSLLDELIKMARLSKMERRIINLQIQGFDYHRNCRKHRSRNSLCTCLYLPYSKKGALGGIEIDQADRINCPENGGRRVSVDVPMFSDW